MLIRDTEKYTFLIQVQISLKEVSVNVNFVFHQNLWVLKAAIQILLSNQ